MSHSTFETRETVTQAILKGKRNNKLTFAQIASAIGRNKVWTTAAILGQHPMSADEAEKVLTVVGVGRDDEFIALMQEIPSRAHRNVLNENDPTIKRLQEVVDVYGPSIKEITHELCGDGIISAIDCRIDVNKKEDPKGDRVVITIDGKFLKYQPW
ncbi:cyanate hydratase-like [Bradysia coprophila]|uniref:cyanate hydratase-like n=1 Tax=Bradysia coprophila TaxID=38358 RepID=UPI00187DB40D|nr:cyanate hydratase-like [Bradysia coprophila]